MQIKILRYSLEILGKFWEFLAQLLMEKVLEWEEDSCSNGQIRIGRIKSYHIAVDTDLFFHHGNNSFKLVQPLIL